MAFKFPKPDSASPVAASELDRAREESKHCEHCSGCGYKTVYHRDWSGSRIGIHRWSEFECDRRTGEQIEILRERAFAAETSAHCVCTLGRLIRSSQLTSLPEMARRVVDGELADGRRSAYTLERPHLPSDTRLDIRPGESITHALRRLLGARRSILAKAPQKTVNDIQRELANPERRSA